MEFFSDELRCRFFNDPKKLLVCNHCIPVIDGIWLHTMLTIENISHYMYIGYCFQYGNSWLKPIISPNFVKKEVRSIQKSKECCPVIFPSGGTMKWKSGFFHLSRNAAIPIYVVRLDYTLGIIEILGRVTVNDHNTFEEVKKHIISWMRSGWKKKSPWWITCLHWFGYGDECMAA